MGLTGAMYKSLRFDGEDSRDYGVYITGEAVFNSPERDVEMISIPGRNGEYARDLGRFTNIEVTYPAGLFGVDEADFADAIADFRNMLGSRVGYCRLEDDYNPGEYRMGVFKAGLEVTPANLKSGEFTITFNCKPQRFLTTGETAVALSSGDDITNPTLFESRPQLQVWGYGDIGLGGSTVSLANSVVGNILISNGGTLIVTPDYSSVASGDTITVTSGKSTFRPIFKNGYTVTSYNLQNVTWLTGTGAVSTLPGDAFAEFYVVIDYDSGTFNYGTASYVGSVGFDVVVSGTKPDSTTYTFTMSYSYHGIYSYANGRIRMYESYVLSGDYSALSQFQWTDKIGPVYANSTKSTLGTPTYIDLDIGDAYYISGSDIVSVNNAVTIPAVLPTLPPGATTITYDNTITQFKVVPRWWKL